MCTLILDRNSLSKTLEIVLRFEIGRWFAGISLSRPGCFSNGVICAFLNLVGKRPSASDKLARCKLANFVLKFPNFRCHGDEGRAGVNFSDTVKLPDLDNPLTGATFLALCLILAELWLILCENFHIFVTMATRVGLI